MKLLSELINCNLKVVSSLYMRKTKSQHSRSRPEIYARRFERSLIREFSFGNSRSKVLKPVVFDAQTTDQIRCEPFKTTAKFQWFWICYAIISFFSYTRTAIQITTESVCCTILAENFCFHRREALCVSDPSKLQFTPLKNYCLILHELISNIVQHTPSVWWFEQCSVV